MPSKFKKVAVLRHKTTVNNTTEADAVRQGGHVQVGDDLALAGACPPKTPKCSPSTVCSDGLRGQKGDEGARQLPDHRDERLELGPLFKRSVPSSPYDHKSYVLAALWAIFPKNWSTNHFFQRAKPPTPRNADHQHTNAETVTIKTHRRTHFQNTDRHEHAPSTHTHETLHSLLIHGVCHHRRVGRLSRREPLLCGGPGPGAALLVGSCVVSVSPSALDVVGSVLMLMSHSCLTMYSGRPF